MNPNNSKNCDKTITPIFVPCRGERGPIGPQGPVGPPGPTGTTTTDSIMLTKMESQIRESKASLNLGTKINSTGTSITFSAPSTITLSKGSYLIQVFSVATNENGTSKPTIAITVDGVIIPTTSLTYEKSNKPSPLFVQHNLTIESPVIINIVNSGTECLKYVGTTISIIKLG